MSKKNQTPVERSEAQKTAKKIGATKYLECSAKTNDGVKNVFDEAIRIALSGKRKKSSCVLL